MYTKNQKFIDAFLKSDGSIRDDRLLDAKVDIYYKESILDEEDKIFTFSSRDILQTMKINENLMGGEYFSFGSACSNQITLNLLFDNLRPELTETAKIALKSKNKIIPYIGICTDEETIHFEYIPMGIYFIYDTQLSAKFKTCTITAYDKMYYLGELPSDTLVNTLYDIVTNVNDNIFPNRPDETNMLYACLNAIAKEYNFDIDDSVLRLVSESITKNSLNAYETNTFYISVGIVRKRKSLFPTDNTTVRELIAYLAGSGGYNAYFNREGNLVFRGRYNKNGTEFDEVKLTDKKNILSLNENDAFDIETSLEPITFGYVNVTYKIFDDNTENESGEESYDAYMAKIPGSFGGNSWVQYEGVYGFIFPRLAGWLAERYSKSYIMQYSPTTVKWRCCPFTECGDTLVVNIDGEDINVPVMEQEIVFAGGLQSTVKSLGKSSQDTQYQQFNASAENGIVANSGNIAGFSIKPRLLSKTFTYTQIEQDENGLDVEVTKNTTFKLGHESGSENANYIISLFEDDNLYNSFGLHSNGDVECGNVILAPGCEIIYSAGEQASLLYDGSYANQQLNAEDKNGIAYLTNTDTGESASILKQKTGIVLAFAQQRIGTTPNPFEVHYFFIPKNALVLSTQTLGTYILHTTVHMALADFSSIGSKRITISDKDGVGQIAGEKSGSTNINISSGTRNGITYDNSSWLLYKVYGI